MNEYITKLTELFSESFYQFYLMIVRYLEKITPKKKGVRADFRARAELLMYLVRVYAGRVQEGTLREGDFIRLTNADIARNTTLNAVLAKESLDSLKALKLVRVHTSKQATQIMVDLNNVSLFIRDSYFNESAVQGEIKETKAEVKEKKRETSRNNKKKAKDNFEIAIGIINQITSDSDESVNKYYEQFETKLGFMPREIDLMVALNSVYKNLTADEYYIIRKSVFDKKVGKDIVFHEGRELLVKESFNEYERLKTLPENNKKKRSTLIAEAIASVRTGDYQLSHFRQLITW